MKRLFIYPAISVVAVLCSAADFPDTDFLWKSFRKTDYNEIHVNRVFVKPIPELQGKRSAKEKKSNQNTRARYKARCDLRNRVLNRIFSDFVPGEKAVVICEKYDLYHESVYEAVVLTTGRMYLAEIYNEKSKGELFRKYELSRDELTALAEHAAKLKQSDGSCRMVDAKDYPTFISVAKGKSGWETVVVSSSRKVWSSVPELQKEYFSKVSKVINFMSMLDNVKNSKHVPPVIVKKK